MSNVELAEKVGMAPSPCLRRVKALQERGFIRGYRAQLDSKKLGLGVQAVCQVKLHDHAEEAVAQFVAAVTAMPEVTACYSMTGRSDFMLMIYATDLDNYGRIATHRLLRLPNVQDVESGLVLGNPQKRERIATGAFTAGWVRGLVAVIPAAEQGFRAAIATLSGSGSWIPDQVGDDGFMLLRELSFPRRRESIPPPMPDNHSGPGHDMRILTRIPSSRPPSRDPGADHSSGTGS